MNERIKQLALQAGFNEYINENLWPEEQPEFNNLMEKFAELIVQECIDIIAPYSVRMIKPGERYLHPIQEIQKNFGVEE